MIWTSELSLSVIVRIQSNPLSTGNGPIKHIATLSPRASGIGRGCKGPAGLLVADLFRKQSVQEGM